MDFKKVAIEAKKAGKTKFKKKILIALEDTKSARIYLESLFKDLNVNAQLVVADHKGTNPKKVLEAIDIYMHKHPDEKFESMWIFIDQDTREKAEFQNVILTASQRNIHTVYSNECYELWLLLHFQDQTASLGRDHLKHVLKSHLNEYEKGDNKIYEKTVALQKEG